MLLFIVMAAAMLAELIHLGSIVGAFMAGLAVNALRSSTERSEVASTCMVNSKSLILSQRYGGTKTIFSTKSGSFSNSFPKTFDFFGLSYPSLQVFVCSVENHKL